MYIQSIDKTSRVRAMNGLDILLRSLNLRMLIISNLYDYTLPDSGPERPADVGDVYFSLTTIVQQTARSKVGDRFS